MATKRVQKRAGLTDGNVRQGDRAGAAGLTASDAPRLTGKRVTRHYSPRARRCACGCGVSFKPKTRRARYFSDACRKRDERKRKAKTMKAKPAEPVLAVCECRYCGNTFFAEQGRGARYCSNSHKELAYRQRRGATAGALAGDLNVPVDEALDMVERMGMKRCGRYLRGKGYVYVEQPRSGVWLLPINGTPMNAAKVGMITNDNKR